MTRTLSLLTSSVLTTPGSGASAATFPEGTDLSDLMIAA